MKTSRDKSGGKEGSESSFNAMKVKRKKLLQVPDCPECRDFHFKKSDTCKVRELKVKMIVQQIKHSGNIKVEN